MHGNFQVEGICSMQELYPFKIVIFPLNYVFKKNDAKNSCILMYMDKHNHNKRKIKSNETWKFVEEKQCMDDYELYKKYCNACPILWQEWI